MLPWPRTWKRRRALSPGRSRTDLEVMMNWAACSSSDLHRASDPFYFHLVGPSSAFEPKKVRDLKPVPLRGPNLVTRAQDHVV